MNNNVRQYKQLLPVAAAIFAILAVPAYLWLRRTVEYRSWFGNATVRTDLCRTLPMLAQFRRHYLLQRLLADSSADVRSAALTALEQSRPMPNLNAQIAALATDTEQPPFVREKAILWFLRPDVPMPAALDQHLRTQMTDPAFRQAHTLAAARWLSLDLDSRCADQRWALLEQALDTQEPTREQLQRILQSQAQRFADLREPLFEAFCLAEDPRNRTFLNAVLLVIGRPVPTAPSAIPPPPDLPGNLIEAEWATDLRPNYHIAVIDGVRCLALGDMAGGYRSWLKGDQGSVDIGTARISLYAPADDLYRVYARVLFSDKCSNSFGFLLGGRGYSNFADHQSLFGQWHWLQLYDQGNADVQLKRGFHAVELKAWEDGVFIDKFALVRHGHTPEELEASGDVPRWDPHLPGAISFAPEQQSQPRGTTQTITIWVRRNSPAVGRGTLRMRLPPPFIANSPLAQRIRFDDHEMLAAAEFRVHLPADAVAGEALMHAEFQADLADAEPLTADFILGAQFDWLTTGPLEPTDPIHLAGNQTAVIDDAALARGWSRWPTNAYNMYRHLDPFAAWGRFRDRFIYLCTDIMVEEAGEYSAFLTVDDHATGWLNGQLWVQVSGHGTAEGRMVYRSMPVPAGRHRLYVKWYQNKAADPQGPDARRHTFNNCSLKLLIRHSRHQIAPAVKGVPMTLTAATAADTDF